MSSSDDSDGIRELLDQALAGEPPLRIDRDAVFRQGRRRVRRRRLLASGGAVGGVVVAAVGAVLLTGPVTRDEPAVPPAASGTETSTHLATSAPVSTSPTLPTTAPPSSVDVPADRAATMLTGALLSADVLPGDVRLSGVGGEKPTFRAVGHGYELAADVLAKDSTGSLTVTVRRADRTKPVTCESIGAYDSCETRGGSGVPIVVASVKYPHTGEKRYLVCAIRHDLTSVTATSTNQTAQDRKVGAPSSDGWPAADVAVLTRIVTIPDLRYPA